MNHEAMAELRAALERDDALRALFAEATTEADVLAIAREAGVVVHPDSLSEGHELSDAELAQVSGGYTFPQTDWIYCDNPWTNAWCTLKC